MDDSWGNRRCRFFEKLGSFQIGSEATGMKERQNISVKSSEPDKVDAYMQKLKHPLLGVVEALRRIILRSDSQVGEEIKWNSPTFFYTGAMKPFNPKEYKRYIVVFNLYRKDCIRLVFPSGAKINDTSGLLEGDYADGRRVASFYKMKDVESKEKALQQAMKRWLTLLDKG
jgi:hypothetical protein